MFAGHSLVSGRGFGPAFLVGGGQSAMELVSRRDVRRKLCNGFGVSVGGFLIAFGGEPAFGQRKGFVGGCRYRHESFFRGPGQRCFMGRRVEKEPPVSGFGVGGVARAFVRLRCQGQGRTVAFVGQILERGDGLGVLPVRHEVFGAHNRGVTRQQ